MNLGKDTNFAVRFLEEIPNIFESTSLFILGAGVSDSYIKPQYEDSYKKTKELLVEGEFLGVYPVIDGSRTPLTSEEAIRIKKLCSPHFIYKTSNGKFLIDETNMDFFDVILHSYPEIFEFICAMNYSLDEYPTFCPEYQIFNLANPNSIIVNLNHDHLAENFIKRKDRIISLHGIITPKMKHEIKKIFPFILDLNLRGELSKILYLATKENEALLLNKIEYRSLDQQLNTKEFKYIVVIGYSFFKKNDFEIYDTVTYDFIRSYFVKKKNKCSLIVIDPNPNFVIDIFSKDTNISKIEFFEIYWNKFTHAFYWMNRLKNSCALKCDITDKRRFMYFYQSDRSDNFESICSNNRMLVQKSTFLRFNKKSFDW